MREHDDNDSLNIATQSVCVCVTVYTIGNTRLLVALRAIIEYRHRHASIAAGRRVGASVIQVCT